MGKEVVNLLIHTCSRVKVTRMTHKNSLLTSQHICHFAVDWRARMLLPRLDLIERLGANCYLLHVSSIHWGLYLLPASGHLRRTARGRQLRNGGRPFSVHIFISGCHLNIPQTPTTHPKVTSLFFLPSLPPLTDSPALMMVPPHTQSRIMLSLLSLFLQMDRSWWFYCPLPCVFPTSMPFSVLVQVFYYIRNLLKSFSLLLE